MDNVKMTYTEFRKHIIYVIGHYDIHLTGFLQYNGEKLYFKCIGGSCPELDDNDEIIEEPLIYALYKLPDNIMKIFEEKNEDFCKYVGTHWQFKDGNRSHNGTVKPSGHEKFYDKYKDVKDPEINESWKTITIEVD